jgi:hypothetical protein
VEPDTSRSPLTRSRSRPVPRVGVARRPRISDAALVFSVLAAAAFAVTRPPVGDFWAARAHESAVLHGVGLTYWFSWFDGTVPGSYSVLAPLVTRFVDAGVVGAASTVVVTLLCHRLVRGSRHATLATWAAALGATASLWSGRIPFAMGTALMLLALLAVRGRHRWLSALSGVVTTLVSPVSGAFLVLGLFGVVVHDPARRGVAIVAAGASGASLIGLAGYFGIPGPEGFPVLHVLLVAATLGLMLLARPVNYVRAVLLISLPLLVVLAAVPNGVGTNFERFAWLCLPVAVIATAQVRLRWAALAAGTALTCSVVGTAHDLYVAAKPMSSETYLAGLIAELDRTPGLTTYRLEVVPDGTHVAAYALLNHAMLARGYETQTDNAQDAALASPQLDATTYRHWLDTSAVGYVALDRVTLKHGPEDQLVRSGTLPYLHPVWSDAHWLLFKVSAPTPIIAAPARIIDADQAELVITTPQAGRLPIRVHWSRFLHVDGPAGARLSTDAAGWTVLDAPRPGQYTIRG